MAWCPNCRSEYVNGRETCYDCGAVLVESLDDIQADAQDMYDFNSMSDEMKRRVLAEAQKENLDPRRLFNPAKEGTVDFVAQMIEEENAPAHEEYAREKAAEEEKRAPAIFEKKEDKYKNFRSGGAACLIVGIAGLVYMIAEMTGLVDFVADGNYMFDIVMTAMFAGFIFAGIHSFLKSGKIKAEADEQNSYMKELDAWIADHFSADSINTGINQSLDVQSLYEARAEKIRAALLARDADMDVSMLEYYVENTYIALFES